MKSFGAVGVDVGETPPGPINVVIVVVGCSEGVGGVSGTEPRSLIPAASISLPVREKVAPLAGDESSARLRRFACPVSLKHQ
jgi:hypothetical protein